MASINNAKPRARRASRAPLGKSLSVDETVLPSTAAQATTFARPNSMLARVSSSSSAVSAATGTHGLSQKPAVSAKAAGAASGAIAPRRVLGDLSNAGKVLDQRSSKDGLSKGTRVRSSSSLSSKPLSVKSVSAVSNSVVATSDHARSTSTASRHSHKSSHSSLSAVNEVPSAQVGGAKRGRAHNDVGAAPGAPRIVSSAWGESQEGMQHEEILDTVAEGDSYCASSGPADHHGLGISMEQHESDEMMTESVADHAGVHDISNDTFELDLDQAFNDAPTSRQEKQSSMQVDATPASNSRAQSVRHSSRGQVQARDPEDWLALRETVQRDVERTILDVQREYKEELDLWDISMVAEYSDEIFAYMEELEVESLPNPSYMDAQTEIEWPMRATLIDWLMQVHMRYHMLPETLWITINIVDRFLSNRVVSLVKLQLVGITAMFIAAKYEEIMAPSVDEFLYMTESNYTREEILKGERIILASLQFQISNYCSPYSWVRRISKADDYDIQTRTLSKFLMEVTLLDHRFLRAKPSLIAAVGMYLARRMLGGDWSEPFIFYSKYTEVQLATPTSFILSAISADDFEEKFVYQKYSSKKFLKASIFARSWAKATLESATRAHELSAK